MPQILLYTSNPNGKLFADHFSDIRMFDSAKYFTGNVLDVHYKNVSMGFAKIVAVKPFSFKRINDVASFINIGKPAAYQATVLSKYYNHGNLLDSDAIMVHIVLEWTEREMDYQNNLLQEWWQSKVDQTPVYLQRKNS